MGKRYGAGRAWYGERRSEMSDEDILAREQKNRVKMVLDEDELKTNAILIVADSKSLDAIGDWVAFDLQAKGFNIRVATPDVQKGVEYFGLPGNNVDILQLSCTSAEEDIFRAIRNVQAIFFAGNFVPVTSFFANGGEGVEYCRLVSRILDLIRQVGIEVYPFTCSHYPLPSPLSSLLPPPSSLLSPLRTDTLVTQEQGRNPMSTESANLPSTFTDLLKPKRSKKGNIDVKKVTFGN